ncbi:MAG TPA: bifunctional 2',3'-cyclic-nucleotide 2'-phosphodiesterase/3'-nucleotidase [Dokdonella sp.]|uniref:bifunctional 2',3'-cyclic-nucleotide 2'-phosphodiesterase/3'-nucleotidase n=1 Tax=Dokdonella sp. TaxID=2291710 RepID=UPI002D7F0EC3|nr:bifunctional 2',3'-cyclic-nucleotide 2'-phosphodiesterase/3'-nucleotidase [Dokdonella sp.]HET9033794.1 bifunctional 2',3'-cyclic-nucleotide 2'-phosphodiesterase/3'-nucleotidase [Dokdonella sp.]
MNFRYPIATIVAISLLLALGCSTAPTQPAPVGDSAHATLAILETTDIHSNILSYDYYKLAEDDSLGFERVATLIREAREEYPNTLLFDAGDTIQGTALADWQARGSPLACDQKLAMYKAMDVLGYDGGTIGNHEFNYGLPYLSQVTDQPMTVEGVTERRCKGPGFPLVLANVFDAHNGQPLFPPTKLLQRTIKAIDENGRAIELPIRIGIIGFTPPSIMLWDHDNLQGKVTTIGVVEAARRYAPELRAEGADLIIAISHGGIDTRPYTENMENAGWYLAEVPDIDVLLMGHSHQVFPDPGNESSRYNGLPAVDNERGFIHGKPAVMGNMWGKSLGLIELELVQRDGHWRIDPAISHAEVRNIRSKDGGGVAADPAIGAAVSAEHEATVAYVSAPIGESDFAMTTYFTAVGDVSALQPVNSAQRAYVERYLSENMPELKGIPVLSAAAPFKAGFGGATDFTDIAAGTLAIRNAADLYLYPNTLSAVKITGAGVKAWLEKSAGYFNRIDPTLTSPQELVNGKTPSYNFDVIQGDIHYAIDISKPYGQRIVDLRFNGKPVDPAQTFILATNNYRASGGGDFPGTGEGHVLINAPDMNRSVLIDWIRQQRRLTFASNGSDQPWHFISLQTAGPVVFHTASGKLDLARRSGIKGVSETSNDGNGMSTYTIDLSASR